MWTLLAFGILVMLFLFVMDYLPRDVPDLVEQPDDPMSLHPVRLHARAPRHGPSIVERHAVVAVNCTSTHDQCARNGASRRTLPTSIGLILALARF